MVAPEELQAAEKTRLQVARKVRELRSARNWTQAELAARLGVSQGRLSALERGDGSFTAEQFLTVLSLFNVPATYFVDAQRSERDLQNALARLGALHLREVPGVVPSERLEQIGSVIQDALVSRSSRLITALGAVLVANVEDINFGRLQRDLSALGLERRLGWLVENVHAAVRLELQAVAPGPWKQSYRRAEFLLGLFLGQLQEAVQSTAPKPPRERFPPDVLDPDIVTPKTLEEVRASASSISTQWGIVTSLRPTDFVEELRAARADR